MHFIHFNPNLPNQLHPYIPSELSLQLPSPFGFCTAHQAHQSNTHTVGYSALLNKQRRHFVPRNQYKRRMKVSRQSEVADRIIEECER